MHEHKPTLPPNTGSGIQSFVRVLTFIGWGVSL